MKKRAARGLINGLREVSALEIAVSALKIIEADFVMDGDCPACDFGPVQSEIHHDECPYLTAAVALRKIKALLKQQEREL